MPVEVPQVLSLLGGFPHIPAFDTYAGFLKVARVLDGGGLGGLAGMLNNVLGGGLGSVLQNPILGAVGLLNGNIAGSITSLLGSGIPGVSGLVTSLNGLTGAANGLLSGVGGLIGLAPGPLGFNFQDIMSHANTILAFGSSVPSAFSLDTVLAPIMSNPLIASIDSAITTITSDVIGGFQTVASAITQVDGFTSQLDALIPASTGALSDLRTALPDIALTLSYAAMTVAAPPGLAEIMPLIVQPAALAEMTAAATAAVSEDPA